MERWEVLESIHGGVFVTPDFSFGEDALALARFAAPTAGQVCELGTGCGVIALLLAQDAASVSAVEIQPQAAALAARSVAVNGLADTVQVICADWNDLADTLSAGSFDCVVCNPPYFAAGGGKQSVSAARRIARHEPDEPEFTAGLSDGAATGETVIAVIPNADVRKEDYVNLLKLEAERA